MKHTHVAVLGAGNAGLALAGKLSKMGYHVKLWNRSPCRLAEISKNGGITLREKGYSSLQKVELFHDLHQAVLDSEIILVTMTADAHAELARSMGPILRAGQVILLIPGRTGGAIEFRNIARLSNLKPGIVIGEASSLVCACRSEGPEVNIISNKSKVSVAAFPSKDNDVLIDSVKPLFSCCRPVQDALQTGFENVASVFHPAVVILNAAAIERKELFYFYRDMTKKIATFLERLDAERIAAARAYGYIVLSIRDWILETYPSTMGDNLYDYMRTCEAYSEIIAPKTIDSRLLTEDVPTGLVPLYHLGNARGVSMPLTKCLVDMVCGLLGRDFWKIGRSLESMGLTCVPQTELKQYLESGNCNIAL